MKTYLTILFILFFSISCNQGFEEGYNQEFDEAWDGFESVNYLQEGGSILGDGESVEGLLKYLKGNSKIIRPELYDLIPEDSNLRILNEARYDLRRLKRIEIEIRFPEETKVEKMTIIEEYVYSGSGSNANGDLNETKPLSEEGPYAEVEVSYRQYVEFEKFTVKVEGKRTYNQDPEVDDFVFYDTTYGTRKIISRVLTQGSFTNGVGNFTRVVYFDDGQIASDVRNYTKNEEGKITGDLSGNAVDGIVLKGSFQIETENTTCVLDDTGTYEYTLYYPPTHSSGKKTETTSIVLDVNGKYNGTYTLENLDGSVLTKALSKIASRPSNCDERVIRRTATVNGSNYEGGAVELSETTARLFTHVYGAINNPDGIIVNVDFYRISGVSVFR